MRTISRSATLGAAIALALASQPLGAAAQSRVPALPAKTVSPTVVDVALRAVAPGRTNAPKGELQTRIYGARTFYATFVFHIAGTAYGFDKTDSALYACAVYDAAHLTLGSGNAHANFNDDGTSYPVTDDIVGVEVDENDRNAPGETWTCTLSVVDRSGKPVPVDSGRSIMEADGAIPTKAR